MAEKEAQPLDPDADLMLRVGAGDEAAFIELFKRHAPALVGFADRFFHNRAIAEELVQEIFIKLYRARRSYKRRSKFTTWLYTIATRTCLNELRRGVHKHGRKSLNEAVAVDTRQTAPAADEAFAGRELAAKVDGVLAELPEKQRAAFMLVRFGGRSYSEAAQILGVTLAAVKSLVFRSTDAMRSELYEE
ncbi:MAG TPA: RNA polymerase sigma factor [Myxococcota bacterium]|nr:RNA polymerase sigma factor [Myxococcota bacterium]